MPPLIPHNLHSPRWAILSKRGFDEHLLSLHNPIIFQELFDTVKQEDGQGRMWSMPARARAGAAPERAGPGCAPTAACSAGCERLAAGHTPAASTAHVSLSAWHAKASCTRIVGGTLEIPLHSILAALILKSLFRACLEYRTSLQQYHFQKILCHGEPKV